MSPGDLGEVGDQGGVGSLRQSSSSATVAKRSGRGDALMTAFSGSAGSNWQVRLRPSSAAGLSVYSASRAISYVMRPEACRASLMITCAPATGSSLNMR